MLSYDNLYDESFFSDNIYKNYFRDVGLHFRIVENGTILPYKMDFGGLVDKDNKFIPQSSLHRGIGGAYTPTEEILQSPMTVIYVGMMILIWGHCLTDDIKRLWFLKSPIYNKYFKNCPVVYTKMGGGKFKQLFEVAEAFGD